MRDERYFPNPDRFMPSRFMNYKENDDAQDLVDPAKLVFGFGRRYVLCTNCLVHAFIQSRIVAFVRVVISLTISCGLQSSLL